ncbi:hypothetical protein GGP41_009307 [Bipolaris sorokiniana]|uniref:HTH CENPB-type domain-containing protein n=1 Tax=Cochliobolus sativus TaxID=45130 RepID=A0A8H5ZH17_COCSA|nr:hypothetical protein GGP41_009307 [Bipolaris sorokiniana]
MDPASQALAQRLPEGVRDTCAARSEHGDVPVSTLIHRRLGRRSRAEQAQSQQYLTQEEEKALVKFLLLMSSLGQPVRVKYLRSLAFSIARQRFTKSESIKRPGKNWPRAFEKRHPELQTRRVRSIDWKRHGNNIYEKIVEWFNVISQVLQDPCVLPENVYNMDEIGVMLSMLGSAKVLVGKNDGQVSRGAGVKRTMVTAIECISADGRALLPLIIWPASTHHSKWTTHETPRWHYAHSENGYNDSKISLEWLKRVFDPQTREGAGGKPRVLILTPVTTEALTSLHDLITKDTHVLKKMNKDRLQRRIQKLASAAKVSFAEQALLKDHNHFLLQINQEAKTRRSTKSVVLGKAKVMSFQDLKEARAKRAAKEHALVGKPKRGRKRKSDALEESTVLPSPKPTVAQRINAPELTHAPVSAWRAPVARMY